MGLPECRSRKALARRIDLFSCTNPQVHAAQGLVSSAVCSTCECRQGPADAENVLTGTNLVSAGGAEGANRTTVWAVGMTTAPRLRPTLEESLASLAAAGWEQPRLFVEPETVLPQRFRTLPATWRDDKLGAFPNWYLGLTELFLRQPLADVYLMCQDDAIFAVGSRAYLEQNLWPAAEVGVVSIYTPSHWSEGRTPGFHPVRHGWASWGALAYAFSNPSLRALLADPLFIKHRHHGAADGLRNIDSAVGAWCEAAGLPYYIHVPSLVQHIGDTSTIWTRASASGPRRAADFIGRVASNMNA